MKGQIMNNLEFDTIEQAQQAADEFGGIWRCVFVKRNGKYGYCCLIQSPPHTLAFEQRGERIVSEHYAGYRRAPRGWHGHGVLI